MNLPTEFKIANQVYKVKVVDYLSDNSSFGEFDSVLSEIRLATKVESAYDGELHNLSEEQILNTFYHELFHCFNWNWNTECDESLAQSFANFMREYESTKK